MPSRRWRFRLQDILDAITRIQSYTHGMTYEQFKADRKTVDAVERNLIVIGEAAARVPEHVAERTKHVPWRQMRDMRNIVVHDYWEIELPRVWDTIHHDLQPLAPLLRAVLETEAEG